jgi:SAM-dependent methyltransferase
MDAEYAKAYERLYRHHWWWRAREEWIVSVLRKAKLPAGARILDVGCGSGLFFDRLAQFGEVEGVEPDAMLVLPDKPYASQIYVGLFDRNFQTDKRYSLILMLDVLEHIEDPQEALSYAVELLEPDGTLLITLPAFRGLWTTHDDLNRHYARYTKSSFSALANSAGMRIDSCDYFFHWLVPLKLAVRLKERLFRTKPLPAKIPPAPLNSAFYCLSKMEQKLFSRMPLPLGTSLLAVGGKKT